MTDPYEELERERWRARVERELRQHIEAQDAELRELRDVMRFRSKVMETPLDIPSWTAARQQSSQHTGLVVASVADWHLDEVVRPEEIFNLNAYSDEIALRRIQTWTEKVVTLPRDYVRGLSLEGIALFATGDLFTGEIHDELKVTNERRLYASVLRWMEPVIAALETIEREYGTMSLHAVVGNHGRNAKKSVFKGRVYDNIEWLFWSMIRDRLHDRGSRAFIDVSQSMDLNVSLYGRNHLLTHGDQFHGGTGISGAYAPLMLGAHRKSKRQAAAQMPMYTMVIGHWHQLINIRGVIMGGCLKGYDEFAFGFNFEPDPDGASQAMWITTPERAQTIWLPVYVQDRSAEGW